MQRRTLLFVLLFSFFRPLSFGAIEDLPSRVREIKLPNGLTALLVERHLSPTISFHIFFPVGSLEDEPGKTGLAHLFEHMMFKGTKTVGVKDYPAEAKILDRIDEVRKRMDEESRRSGAGSPRATALNALKAELDQLDKEHEKLLVPEEYWKIYERAGAQGLNAGTSTDFTEYAVDLPANKIELWMAMESDRLKNAVLREFYKERAVVMEERRMRVDTSPEGKLAESFLHAAFDSHPYGEPVVGRMEDVEHLTRQDAVLFYRRHYLLSRGVIVMVGDFSTESSVRLLQKYFGPTPSQADSPRPARSLPPVRIDREIRVEVPFDAEPEILVGYLRPPLGHSDEAAIEALANVLDLGRTSRLYQDLVEQRRIALSAGVWSSDPGEREPNLFVFHATPRSPHRAEDCLRAIDQEIEKIKKEPPSPWELGKVKNNLEADLLRTLSSNSGLGWRLGYYQALLGNWHYMLDFLERLKAVTPEDVSRVARTYLDPHRRVIAVRVKKEQSR